MATTTTPVSEIRKIHPVRRTAGFLVIVVLVAVLGAIAWFYSVARSALPQLEGTIRVPGLFAPVRVIRDIHGVPTIEAESLSDLYFTQGYVIAQDRLWQMDGMRRFAAGELAEVLGSGLIERDREQRILGLRFAARRALEVISPEERSYFDAYARGVTAYIESRHDRLPLEFRILRYSPRTWTAEDSMLISALMIKDLNHYPYKDALAREKILAKLGPELTTDLFVNTSWHDRPPTASRPTLGNQKNDDEEEEEIETEKGISITWRTPAFDSDSRLLLGSNNWVVSGAHTVSGKPLLSNDPHLGHQMPNLWYEVHLRSGKLDVAGVALPGTPAVILGHNQRIAWGFTNVGPTVEDLYLETFNSDGQYLTPQGWKHPQRRQEIIHVKGKPDVAVDVVVTRHGPIITELIRGETRQVALRWTAYEGARSPFFDLDSAQNWQEFRAALSKFDAPGQNVVYADVDGNIGYQASGKIPIRASGDGSLPENGSDDAHEWTGYIPFEKLPNVFNPASGIIATANGRIAPDNYPYSISTGWESPWRTSRIYRVLESGKKFSAADMLELQTDIYSEFERYSAERFVYAVDHANGASARSKQAAEIMRNWDGRMSGNSPAPVLASRARYELMRLLLEPKLGPAPDSDTKHGVLSWKTYNWGMESVWLENVFLHQPKRWLPEKFSNYDDLLTAAVENAVSGDDVPKDLSKWDWGSYHPLEIQHPILSQIPILRRWTAPGLQSQSGSGFTVKAVTRHAGPSERMTVDLADFDHSTLNIVNGESGNFLSSNYMDQWKAWYEGYTFPFPFSMQAVENARVHELRLQP